jgi:hypothetical protein
MEERVTLPSRTRAASLLLAFVLPADDIEHVVGDLEEELASSPLRRGHRWYWSQLARSLPSLAWLPIRRTGWLKTLAVAVAACVVQAGIELVVGSALYQLSWHEARWATAISMAITLPSLVFVARFAARISPGSATAVAAIAACVIIGRILAVAVAGHQLPSEALAALVLVPSLAFTGGALACKIRRA